MTYYLGTDNKQKADQAYLNEQYNSALSIYEQCFEYLQQEQIKNPDLKNDLEFNDSYIYILTDMIKTRVKIIEKTINPYRNTSNPIDIYRSIDPLVLSFLRIDNGLFMMRNLWSCRSGPGVPRVEQIKTIIDNTYHILAIQFKNFSELLTHLRIHLGDAHEDSIALLNLSIDYLKKAINSVLDSGSIPQINTFISYFSLLQKKYGLTKDKAYLAEISKQINELHRWGRHVYLSTPHKWQLLVGRLQLLTYIILIQNEIDGRHNPSMIEIGEKIIATLNMLELHDLEEITVVQEAVRDFYARRDKSKEFPIAYQIAQSSLPSVAQSSNSQGTHK